MAEDSARALSFLTPEQVSRLGQLPGEGVVGFFTGEGSGEQGFRPNRVFIDFMHEVLRTKGPEDAGLQAAAAAQGEGWVYVIDLRTPEGPQGRVPFHDVVGAFKVEAGLIVEGSYWANEDHRVFTRDGMVRLASSLHEALVEGVMRRRRR